MSSSTCRRMNSSVLLFDDVPFLEVAQQEHDRFAEILREQGVEVLYLEKLVAEAFDAVPEARAEFQEQWLAEAGIKGKMAHRPLRSSSTPSPTTSST